ncbi:hypothetical protein [Elizabethkingia anophelis]|uniref:hypothetical protein n=1 Tax=Elizabethkingia anophelis TaxID=1117645 RepID=UPI00136EDAA0|nr:hypothetical protein [Elizabethkingia anophelis]MYY43992.1 hypothetical protein [Elizabethkingia anophelis]
MKMLLLILSLAALISCNKQKSSEFAEGNGNGIVGKWKLVELQGKNAEKENYYISFDSNGDITASDFPCPGTYSFDEKGGDNIHNKNLTVSFKNCTSSSALWYSIKKDINVRLLENDNILAFNSVDCDEGCNRTFRRVK